MSKWGWLIRGGGFAAAPFTAGWSIPAANVAAGLVEKKQHANDGPNGGGDDKPEHPEDPFTSKLLSNSEGLKSKANEFGNMSAESIGPVLQYLKSILGDDPSAILDATRQDRGRVIDQYDTARQTIAQFGPRGGGTTSALAESRFSEAETLADLTSSKRSEAVALSGQLGTAFAGLGLSADQLADADLNTILNAILAREGFDVAKRGQNMEALAGIGEAVGTIIASKVGGGDK